MRTIPPEKIATTKGLVVRINLLSISRTFSGFRDLAEALLFVRGFSQNTTLVNYEIYENGTLLTSTRRGENLDMGKLADLRAKHSSLLPFADKGMLVTMETPFYITGMRKGMSGNPSKLNWFVDIRFDVPNNYNSSKAESDKATLTFECAPWRDPFFTDLCEECGIDLANGGQATQEYGPAVLVQRGRMYDIDDAA